jgi:protoporphyrinogen oxidase
MRGSFGRLVGALVARLREAGVRLALAAPVRQLSSDGGSVEVRTRDGAERFASVLFTAAPAELLRVAGDRLPAEYRTRVGGLPATAALCVVLELSRSLSPYYWLNIADPDFPFGGLIEHTNYIPRERYGGRHVLYISKYLFAENPLWRARDADVWATYRPYLRRINPEFDESWVLARHHFKANYAQPVIPRDYPSLIPPFDTPLPGVYHACMAQIYPEDRGQNYAVRSGNRAAAALLERLA